MAYAQQLLDVPHSKIRPIFGNLDVNAIMSILIIMVIGFVIILIDFKKEAN